MKLSVATTNALLLAILLAHGAPAQFATGGNYSSGSRSSGTTFGGYPVGTQTSGMLGGGTTFGGSPYSKPLGGSNYGVAGTGYTNLYNVPGYGYFTNSNFAQQIPRYTGTAVAIGGATFPYGGLGAQNGYWLSTSGFYYPFYPTIFQSGSVTSGVPGIYQIQAGALAQVKPPIGAILNDMRQFIDAAKAKHQLDQSNYDYIFNRISGITEEAATLGAKNGGTLDSQDEVLVRRDLELLSADIARALNP